MPLDSDSHSLSQPVSQDKLHSFVDEGAHLLATVARGAAYSGVEAPIKGATQLAGMSSPELVQDNPNYKFNTAEWYASTIGHGIGAMLPYLATSKLTGTFIKSAGIGKAILDGAATGFVFTPTSGDGAFSQRAEAALSSATMFGAQQYLAGKVMPLLAPLDGVVLPTIARLGVNAGAGAVAGTAGMEVQSFAGGHGLVTDKEALLQNAVAAASTGFALDAVHLTGQAIQQARTSIAGSNFADGSLESKVGAPHVAASLADGNENIAESRKVAGVGDASIDFASDKKSSPVIEAVGKWSNGELNAREYKTSGGQSFWQTDDGRIFFTESRGEDTLQHVWTPHGIFKPQTAFTGMTEEGRLGFPVFQRHEPQGSYLLDGHLAFDDRANDWNTFPAHNNAPPIEPELRARLTVPLPRGLEPDFAAAQRILPTSTGQQYTLSRGSGLREIPGDIPEDVSFRNYYRNHVEKVPQQYRNYNLLSVDGADRLAHADKLTRELRKDLLDNHATSVRISETYAKQMDELRELRKTATLDPELFTEQREQILEARRDLFVSPYRDRYLPEHWAQFLDVLPNPSRLSRLESIDWQFPSPDNSYGATVASADHKARIAFWNGNDGVQQSVRQVLLHEYSHLIESVYPTLFKAFQIALPFDRDFLATDYAGKSNRENFAVHNGEMMMDPNPEMFLTLAREAPFKTVILNEVLRGELEHADPNNPHLDGLRERVKYVDEHVLPAAKEQLAEILQDRFAHEDISAALRVLKTLDSDPSTQGLREKLISLDEIKSIASGYATEENSHSLYNAANALMFNEYLRPHTGPIMTKKLESKMRESLADYAHDDLSSSDSIDILYALELAKSLTETGVIRADSPPSEKLVQYADLWHVIDLGDANNTESAFSLLSQIYPLPSEPSPKA